LTDSGEPASNLMCGSELGTLEREPFKDSLAIITRFRGFVRQHFRLDSL
jgi:hypothetical protein